MRILIIDLDQRPVRGHAVAQDQVQIPMLQPDEIRSLKKRIRSVWTMRRLRTSR